MMSEWRTGCAFSRDVLKNKIENSGSGKAEGTHSGLCGMWPGRSTHRVQLLFNTKSKLINVPYRESHFALHRGERRDQLLPGDPVVLPHPVKLRKPFQNLLILNRTGKGIRTDKEFLQPERSPG